MRVRVAVDDVDVPPDASFLAGDGEMARLMRELDWSATPIGPIGSWPQSLRIAVSLGLASRFPIEIWWGPQYAHLYNDAYRPILGATKHPQFLGRPGRECWGEVWDVIGPMLESVRATGRATWAEDFQLLLTRNGYLEEAYFTFSYAPILIEDGSVGGIFCACAETTARVLGERRLRTLRALGEQTAAPRANVESTCARALETLGGSVVDVPFALLYLVVPGRTDARLVAATGLPAGTPANPERHALVDGEGVWPLAEAARTRRPVRVENTSERFSALPGGPWPEPPREALVLPLVHSGQPVPLGFLVVGVSPRRALDGAYADFFELAAGHIATIISSAQIEEEERRHARRARLGADVGAALTSSESLPEQLRRCTQALVDHLDAAFARIWVLDEKENVLELEASAGMYTHLDGPHSRVAVGALKIGLIAQEREPHLTNDVLNDPRVGDRAWAAREGMVSFAGYPLIISGRLVGVMAMFARRPLDEEMLRALASVADSIAVGVERKRIEDERAQLLAREQVALAEAERQRSRLESLFMQAPAGICVLRGPEHVFELANPRYLQLIGDRDILGRRVRDALPEIEGQSVVPLLDRVYRTGEPFFGNEFQVFLDRRGVLQECFFNFVYQPIFDTGRRAEGIAVLAFEVTDLINARRRAEELTRKLAASNQELDQFAYVASHDLKAPLRGIASLSEWLEEDLADRMGEEARRQMHLLRGRVHRLEALINGILSYSRAGRVRERLETVDVGALLVETRDLLAPPPETIITIGQMPTLLAERVALQQVFLNLLSNAMKHAQRPGVRIEIACREAGAFFDFTVRDDGPGIAPQYHERIWGIFQTLEARDKVEGAGIGLAVVKKIVESRGGRATVESEPGAGATFHVYWPKRPTDMT